MLVGDLVRIKNIRNKRVWGLIKYIDSTETEVNITIVPCYVPSPKSTLKGGSFFSKFKGRIIWEK